MNTELVLVFTKAGFARALKGKKNLSLARHEIGVKVKIVIPDHSFKGPMLEAEMEVTADQVITPVVSVQVQSEGGSRNE